MPAPAGPAGEAEDPALGVGVDLLEIGRLERALERHPRLAGRLFSERELAYAGSRARPGRHLAARFAAKEATIKALGMSAGFGLAEVEIEAGEPPRPLLTGRAAEIARRRGVEVKISLTHGREISAAIAVASPG